MTNPSTDSANRQLPVLREQVRSAVIWRSGTQIFGQMITWTATFLVIRILAPSDYGLFSLTQVVLSLLNMLNGAGLASALIRRKQIDTRAIRQLFGMLLLLNVTLALFQIVLAPIMADYYRQPQIIPLLRVQAILYLLTPFIALPQALLSRKMDFRKQAQANLLAGVMGAMTALGGALSGLGVWTLIVAPMAVFATQGLAMTWAARSLVWPSFDFRGAGDILRYGGMMTASSIFWLIQTQSDVLIAGRLLDLHMLGLYTESLFLTQIFNAKFLPPLNEVAFSAYARIQHDTAAVAAAFAKSARLILVIAMPFYLGLAVTAEPVVAVAMGPKWLEAAPVVHLLALAMPFSTLHFLFAPASDACGYPGISARNSAIGMMLMPLAFAIGVHWGVIGLALAWLAAQPLYTAIVAWRTLPVLGLTARALIAAIAPPVVAATVMMAAVAGVDHLLPVAMTPFARLLVLVSTGVILYGVALILFAYETLTETWKMIRGRMG